MLDHIRESRCPECGQPFDPADAATYLTSLQSPIRWEPFASLGCWIVYGIFYSPGPIFRLHRAPDHAVYSYFLPVFALLAFGMVAGFSSSRQGPAWLRVLGFIGGLASFLTLLGWVARFVSYQR